AWSARSGTRARSGGGVPPDRVQSGHQRIRPSLGVGVGGNTITMARSMPSRLLIRCVLVAAGLVLAMACPRAEDFYKGKSISLVIATATGGGYDTYARLIARHLGRHIPGQPAIVPQNMPGAAGIRAANYLYAAAPKDGTAIGMLDQATYLDQVLGTPGLTADATRLNWIGRILSNSAVLYAWHLAKVKRIEDALTQELIVSTSGAASRLNWTVLNNVVGTRLKIITGYQGSSDSRLAMIRGEVDALSQPWPVLKVEAEQLLRDRQINLLVQTGADKHPELAHVPRMIDLAKSEDDRTLLTLFSSPST